jgi:hypothetical protein
MDPVGAARQNPTAMAIMGGQEGFSVFIGGVGDHVLEVNPIQLV